MVATKGKEMETTNAVVTEATKAMVKAAVVATTKTQKNHKKNIYNKTPTRRMAICLMRLEHFTH